MAGKCLHVWLFMCCTDVPVMSKENMYLTVTDVVCHVVFVCIDISEGMYNCVEIQKAIQSAFCSLVLSFQPSDLKCNK